MMCEYISQPVVTNLNKIRVQEIKEESDINDQIDVTVVTSSHNVPYVMYTCINVH